MYRRGGGGIESNLSAGRTDSLLGGCRLLNGRRVQTHENRGLHETGRADSAIHHFRGRQAVPIADDDKLLVDAEQQFKKCPKFKKCPIGHRSPLTSAGTVFLTAPEEGGKFTKFDVGRHWSGNFQMGEGGSGCVSTCVIGVRCTVLPVFQHPLDRFSLKFSAIGKLQLGFDLFTVGIDRMCTQM